MRIAFYGNLCNNLYQCCRALRAHTSFDIHLFIDAEDSDHQQMPESDDSDLASGYPDWIHRLPPIDRVRLLVAPWTSPLIPLVADFDALVVSGYGPILAQFVSTPTFFFTAGGDLTQWPFPFRYQSLYNSWTLRLGQLLRAFWQRRGIRRCREVWTQPFAPYRLAVSYLGLPGHQVSNTYFPLVIDTKKFVARPAEAVVRSAMNLREAYDFIVFHPSRMMILSDASRRDTGDWKANDRLIMGFALFVKNNPGVKAALVLVDRIVSRDIDIARRLVQELGIESSVVWLPPPRPGGFSREELIDFYSVSDVVADDFGSGWFGSVTLEALAVGIPVVSFIDEVAMGMMYPEHPIQNAQTESEIGALLERLVRDPAYRQDCGQRGRRWIETYHSDGAAGAVYARHFKQLANRLGHDG